jgi:hypothetical protein
LPSHRGELRIERARDKSLRVGLRFAMAQKVERPLKERDRVPHSVTLPPS